MAAQFIEELRRLVPASVEPNPAFTLIGTLIVRSPRIDGELQKLGIDVPQATVARYLGRHHYERRAA